MNHHERLSKKHRRLKKRLRRLRDRVDRIEEQLRTPARSGDRSVKMGGSD